MKIKKLLPVLLLALVLLYIFLPGGDDSSSVGVIGGSDGPSQIITTDIKTEPVPDAGEPEDVPAIDYEGSYTSKEDVALYIYTYGCLPGNFVTKNEARDAGWEGGSVEKFLPGMAIGGDRFGNREGLLPDAEGRVWTECDINTLGASGRGAERIVFSNDGLIFYTDDHYESFEQLYG